VNDNDKQLAVFLGAGLLTMLLFSKAAPGRAEREQARRAVREFRKAIDVTGIATVTCTHGDLLPSSLCAYCEADKANGTEGNLDDEAHTRNEPENGGANHH